MAKSVRKSTKIPEGYAAKLHRARASRAMEGERRVLTLLFCDVTGSTAMAERLDPEEWAEIMNEAFHYMVAPIYTYEGTVARLMGDAVLALFGAPIAHEDDPQRAVLAGLDIVTGIEKFTAEIKQLYGMDFNLRVGINTGPVVVGEIGPDLAVEYTALGDAVNLAARMEQTAEPGTVQIAENTFHLIEPFFDITPLGQLAVKGKEEPVNAYRVEGIAARPGSLRGIEGLDSPMVGRDQELAELQRITTAVRDSGRGHIIFLIGEAGLGKSRLVDELKAYWLDTRRETADGWDHWEEMAAASFESTRPFGLVKHQLRSACHITAADSAEQARGKLAHMVRGYPPALQERLNQLFAILLGIGRGESGLRPEGEDFKRELFAATLEATRLRAKGQPTVLVADDVQWADPASIEDLENLLQLLVDNPYLFLVVMRAEPQIPAWLMKERVSGRYAEQVTEIHLKPLSGDESANLVDILLPVRDLPPALRDRILQRTDGNPFFIEEVIRALLDRGALEQREEGLYWNPQQSSAEFSIPGNVQALLAARIDRLEKDVRHTLQLASVIGRNFYRRVLDMISEYAVSLDEQLNELENLALIREAARLPELEYTFRHALTRDATYATILHRQRRQFHKRVGEAFETLFPDRLEEEAHRLAEHFKEALILDKAQHYYTMAGDQAMRLSANQEAAEHYTRGLALAKEVGSDDQLLRLYLKLGRTLELGGRYDDALNLYREMEDLSVEQAIPALKLQALLAKATIRSTFTDKFDARLGFRLAHQALSLAQELGDPRAESKAYWNLSLMGTYTDRNVQQTIDYGERAVAIARKHRLKEELAFALHDLARPYVMAGRIADGETALEEAEQLWRELGRYNMLADNRTTLAENLSMQGKLDQAIELSREAEQISRQSSNNWGLSYALGTLAPLLLETGQVDEALAAWEECLEAGKRANFTAPQYYARAYEALSLAHLGDLDRAFAILQEVQNPQDGTNLATFSSVPGLGKAQLHILAGDPEKAQQVLPGAKDSLELARSEPIIFSLVIDTEILLKLALGQFREALAEVDKALDLVEEDGLALARPELLLLKARALVGLDRFREAAGLLTEAANAARSFGAKKTLLPILAQQVEIEKALGKKTAAATARQEGQAIIAYFLQHISNHELRQKFLNTDTVLILSKNAQSI
jgi:class 3 adenylate cyclase/tetratricopeptide (TPR) repeat protein